MVTKRMGGIGALVAAACAASCAALAGLDQDFRPAEEGGGGSGGATTSSTTASSSAGGSGGGGEGGGCVLATVPSKPAGEDTGGDVAFVTALRSIQLDEKSLDVTVGLDLDGVCSCLAGGEQSCTPFVESVCDGPGGIDNAVGLIFATVYEFSSGLFSSAQIGKAASDGKWSSLFRVTGYSGETDDPKVDVKVYLTQGVNAGMPVPLWDGNDAWPVDDTSLAMPPDIESAVAVASEAYVAGGVLVARLPTEKLRLRSTLFRMDLELSDVVIRARLEEAPGGYRLVDGVFGGKWLLTDVFKGIASIRYTGDNKLCTDDDDYLAVKEVICGNADLLKDGGEGTCDTLSFGATFTADPAQLGAVVPAESAPSDPCPPETDPTTDVCQ